MAQQNSARLLNCEVSDCRSIITKLHSDRPQVKPYPEGYDWFRFGPNVSPTLIPELEAPNTFELVFKVCTYYISQFIRVFSESNIPRIRRHTIYHR